MASLSLRGVRKDFGKTRVIQGVDLDVADGEFVVFVGPSGCGKSTLLRLIAGLEDADAGEIRIGGRVVDGVAAKDRDIAMVFQNYALYPHMSVARNMGFGLRARRLPAADVDRRVRATAAVLGLEALLERRPGELSGGQRQRVAMGRAMVREPAVFLFDEPLSNLDAQLRDQVRTEIKTLHQRVRTTSIYVTHDQMEAMTLADRIVLLRAGRVEQVGAPMELFARPANRFVAGFIGAPAMNFCAGRLEDGAVVLPWGRVATPPLAAAAVDGPVEVGVRPEDFFAGEAALARPEPHRVEARVTIVEPLGSEALLLVELAGVGFRLRIPGKTYPKPGDTIAVALDPAVLHLFDAGNGIVAPGLTASACRSILRVQNADGDAPWTSLAAQPPA